MGLFPLCSALQNSRRLEPLSCCSQVWCSAPLALRRDQRRRTWLRTEFCKQLWLALHIGRINCNQVLPERGKSQLQHSLSCRRITKLARSDLLCMKCEYSDTAGVILPVLSTLGTQVLCWHLQPGFSEVPFVFSVFL